jgi:predicted phage tail protein
MPPAAVRGLAGTTGSGEAGLNWTDPGDSDLDHIEITWSPGDDAQKDVEPGEEAWTVSGLSNDTEYRFTVRAVDLAGNKSPARTLSLTPGDAASPDDMTRFSAAGGNSRAVFTWVDPLDDDFDHVEITWTPGDGALNAEKGDEGGVVPGLTNETAYSFTVRAVDLAGNKSAGYRVTLIPSVFHENWTSLTGTQSTFSTSEIFGIAFGGGTFVAVGAAGKMANSTKGQQCTSDTNSSNSSNS